MAECHLIGQLIGASDFPGRALFCKYDIHFGESWKLVSGLKGGQTQVDSPQLGGNTYWCHPLDVHFVTKSIQGWPKIHLEIYHQDEFGRNELHGYGFLYLPTRPGNHSLTCVTWRPTGSLRDDIRKFFLGGGFQLKKSELVFTGNDRYRLQTETMGKVYFEIGVILRNFHKYGVECLLAFKSYGVDTHNTCKDDLCLKQNLAQTGYNFKRHEEDKKKVDLNFSFENDTNILSNKDIYFTATSKGPLNEDLKERINEEATLSEVLNSSENTENIISLLNETKENTNVTDVTEITKSNFGDIASSTAEPNFTNLNSLSTVNPNMPTTQIPQTISFFFEMKKHKKDICFCDLHINQCDINCCCDDDCNIFHFKIFTRCIEKDYIQDTKYCYKNNFIFGNNTSNLLIQNSGGLFCIVRENLIHSVNYKTEALTSLEAFNRSLPKTFYNFSYKSSKSVEFKSNKYLAESPVWALINGELTPFKIPYSSVGLLCNSEVKIKYLVDQVKICYYQKQPGVQCGRGSKLENMFHYLKNVKIISNLNLINQSDLFNSSKICKRNICIDIILYLCQNIDDMTNCTRISESSNNISGTGCWSALSYVQYKFWHNGSEGIIQTEAYLWVKKLAKASDGFPLQLITEVKYSWMGFTGKVFKRSGNPGYLTGKPILAGKKVYHFINGTTEKKEAIKLSSDSKDWLSVLGSKKGICSSSQRIPINFRQNGKFMCSIKLSQSNFSEENCIELQNNIFKLLIENNVINEAKENFFNKFVATFGNSRVEETGDWVQVLIDFFPVISSQATFKSNHYLLMCKNIITDLYIDIIYSKIGSFFAPQAKILGVSFYFGPHKDLTYFCDTPGCENTFLDQYYKLSTAVRFVDVSKPAVDAFSEPLSLETKLSHDFFYPFFSKSVRSQVLNKLVVIVFLCVFF